MSEIAFVLTWGAGLVLGSGLGITRDATRPTPSESGSPSGNCLLIAAAPDVAISAKRRYRICSTTTRHAGSSFHSNSRDERYRALLPFLRSSLPQSHQDLREIAR